MTIQVPSNVKDPDKVRQRRAQIIRAAVQLFAEKGFHKTTTREIAQASGLSTGAVYEYVASKEDILYLVCQAIHAEMERKLMDSLAQSGRAADRLRNAVEAFFRVIDTMQEDILLIYQQSKALPPEQLRAVLADEVRITGIFEQILRAGLADGSLSPDPEAIPLLAHDIVVCGEMWAFRRWALRGMDLEQFMRVQTQMLLQACGCSLESGGGAVHHGG